MLRGIHLAAVAAALVPLLLSGCSTEPQTAPRTTAPPSATATPAFATKEQAFAAAEKVYRRYLTVTARAAERPADARRQDYAGIATSGAIKSELSSLGRAATEGLHGEGKLDLDRFVGQRFDQASGMMTAYVCVDYSKTRIVSKSGEDVTGDRPVTRTSVARFTAQPELLFAGQAPYAGKAMC